MRTMLRVALAICAHELRAELRRPVALAGIALFGAGALVTLHIALAGSGSPSPEVLAGALWVVLLFAALLGIGRAVAIERDEGTWDALLLAAADRSAIFVGKALAATGITLALHAVLVLTYFALFGTPAGASGYLLVAAAVVLADVGFAATGILVGVLALRARGRELLTATTFVPLSMPLVICAVSLSLEAFGAPAGQANVAQLLLFLLAYDATFIAAGVAAVPELAVE